MRMPEDTHKRIMSAYELLQSGSISIDTFEHIRTILKGLHPGIDKKLEACSKALGKIEKIGSGDLITLSTESLPEGTEEQKKRKKALIFFITSIKDLRSEINRINKEFTNAEKSGNTQQSGLKSWGRIIAFGKGPFGIVTLIALVVIGVLLLIGNHNSSLSSSKGLVQATLSPTAVPSSNPKIPVIIVNDKKIPLNQLHIGQPHIPGCDSQHYHANGGVATALDGTKVIDPGGCGFGKVKDVRVIEVSQ